MSNYYDPADITVQLMAIDSTSGREGEVIAWVDQVMQVVTPAQASAGAGAGTVAPA